MCLLGALTKVEERELPMPWVVYEAVYTPQNNVSSPHFAPAEVRLRFGAPAKNEVSLKNHLQAQAAVPCHAPLTPGTCLPGAVVADVAPFDSERVTSSDAPRSTGCAAIEAAVEQDRLNQAYEPSDVIPERFTFQQGSAELGPKASEAAGAVAQRMTADSNLDCVGLVGQISSGEPVALAHARARAVKALLESLGVAKGRLMTLAVTSRAFGPASNPQPADSDNRRVTLTVVLGSSAGPASPPAAAGK